MEVRHRELIRSNYTKLKASMRENIETVCDNLYEKKIITSTMKERVLCDNAPSRQSSNLLDLIVNRGARAFRALYEACKQSGLKDTADILEPDKSPHKISAKTGVAVAFQHEKQPLPDVWPSEEHFKKVESRKLSVKQVTKERNPEMFGKFMRRDERLIYDMSHKVRGNALIILNRNFPLHHQRSGSEWDLQGLEQLFEGLGFNVIHQKNLTENEINKAIEKEMKTDHQDHDCFVFFIMSYGAQGIVFDIHKMPVTMRSIVNKFNEVEDLRNKPKLLFFQACQGDEKGEVHRHVAEAQPVQNEDEALGIRRRDGAMPGASVLPDIESLSIPSHEDTFVFRSSPDGTLSYRNTDWGSWFTQAIIYVFSEHAHEMELDELQLRVNTLVSKATTTVGKYKNIGEYISVPGKKFYFFPGLYRQGLQPPIVKASSSSSSSSSSCLGVMCLAPGLQSEGLGLAS